MFQFCPGSTGVKDPQLGMEIENMKTWKQLGVMTCEICQFKTSDQGILQAHICRKKSKPDSSKATIKHNKCLKTFLCTLCSFEAEVNDFMEHLQKHLVHHPFKCDTCKKGFSTRHLIDKHCREKHPSAEGNFTLRISSSSIGILRSAKEKGECSFNPAFCKQGIECTGNEVATLQNKDTQKADKQSADIQSARTSTTPHVASSVAPVNSIHSPTTTHYAPESISSVVFPIPQVVKNPSLISPVKTSRSTTTNDNIPTDSSSQSSLVLSNEIKISTSTENINVSLNDNEKWNQDANCNSLLTSVPFISSTDLSPPVVSEVEKNYVRTQTSTCLTSNLSELSEGKGKASNVSSSPPTSVQSDQNKINESERSKDKRSFSKKPDAASAQYFPSCCLSHETCTASSFTSTSPCVTSVPQKKQSVSKRASANTSTLKRHIQNSFSLHPEACNIRPVPMVGTPMFNNISNTYQHPITNPPTYRTYHNTSLPLIAIPSYSSCNLMAFPLNFGTLPTYSSGPAFPSSFTYTSAHVPPSPIFPTQIPPRLFEQNQIVSTAHRQRYQSNQLNEQMGSSNCSIAHSSSFRDRNMIASEKTTNPKVNDVAKGGVTDVVDERVNIVKQENFIDHSYFNVVNNVCFCLKCKEKFNKTDSFYRHIHKHIHTPAQSCCSSGFSLNCSLLQGIISTLDNKCVGQLKQMRPSHVDLSNGQQIFDLVSSDLKQESDIMQDCHSASSITSDVSFSSSDQVRRSSCEVIIKDDFNNAASINKCHSSSDSFLQNHISEENTCDEHIQKNATDENTEMLEDNLEQYHGILHDQITKNFYKCCFPSCRYSSDLSVDLLVHTEALHGNETKFHCLYCGFIGNKVTDLTHHIILHNVNQREKYSCSIIVKGTKLETFSHQKLDNLLSYLEAKSKDHENCEFECNICEKRFLLLPKLKTHLQFSALKTFSCLWCNRTFLDSKSLESHHVKLHPNKAKYQRVNFNFLCQFRKQYSLSFCEVLKQQIVSASTASRDLNEVENLPDNTISQSSDQPVTCTSLVQSPSFTDTHHLPLSSVCEKAVEVPSVLSKSNSDNLSVTASLKSPVAFGNRLFEPHLSPESSSINPTQSLSKVSRKPKPLLLGSNETTVPSTSIDCFVNHQESRVKASGEWKSAVPSSSSKLSSAQGECKSPISELPCDFSVTAVSSSYNPGLPALSSSNICHPSEPSATTQINLLSSDITSPLDSSQSKQKTESSSDCNTMGSSNDRSAVSSFNVDGNNEMIKKVEMKRKGQLNAKEIVEKKLKLNGLGQAGTKELEIANPKSPKAPSRKLQKCSSPMLSGGASPSQCLSVICSNTTSAPIFNSPMTVSSKIPIHSDTLSHGGEEKENTVDEMSTSPNHFTDSIPAEDKENEEEIILYSCKLCSYDCEWNKDKMNIHITDNDNHKYLACWYCGNPYYEPRLLRNHIRFHHDNASFKYKDLDIEHIFSPKVKQTEGFVLDTLNEEKSRSEGQKKTTMPETKKTVQVLIINNTDNQSLLEDRIEKIDQEHVKQEIVIHKDDETSLLSSIINDEKTESVETKTTEKFGCKHCFLIFDSISAVENHSRNTHGQFAVRWIDCHSNNVFTLSGRLLDRNVAELPAKKYLCNLCSYRSERRSLVHKHQKESHPGVKNGMVVELHFRNLNQKDSTSNPLSTEIAANECNKEVKSQSQPLYYNCHLCPAKLSSEFFLRYHLAKHGGFRHMSTLSTLDGVLICAHCNYIAHSNLDLANHVALHVTDRRYTCSLCECESHHKKSIERHIRKHHGQDCKAKVLDRERKKGKMKLQVVNLNPTVSLKRLRNE